MIHLRHVRHVLVGLLAAVVLTACGGGGGGVVDGGQDPPPVGDGDTQAALEACLPGALDEMSAYLGRVDDLLAGGGAAAGFLLPAGGVHADPTSLSVDLLFDELMDMSPDAIPMLAFFDAEGAPTNPYTAQQTSDLQTNGVGYLGTLLPLLADGAQLQMQHVAPEYAVAECQVTWSWAGGAPGACSGHLVAGPPECRASLEWTALPWASVSAAYPSGTFGLILTSGLDQWQGTLVADGTATALIDVSQGGGAVTQWTYDFDTGQAEPR